jgi:hypothetical protein
MTTIELKSKFHKLIDNINNDNVLSKFYDILSRVKESAEGSLWDRLSPDEQDELILIERESHNPENLISHSEMIKKHKKWL